MTKRGTDNVCAKFSAVLALTMLVGLVGLMPASASDLRKIEKDQAEKTPPKQAEDPADGSAGKSAEPAQPKQTPAKETPQATKIAHIRLTGPVLSSPPEFSLFGSGTKMTLADWLRRLAKARRDPSVKVVALEINAPLMNWAQAQELADAIRRLDEVKPVHVHMTAGGAGEYLVASAGRELSMDPAGELMLIGLGMEAMFFRGTLDKLGIEPQFVQVGRFKGASEPMERAEPSDELKSMYNWLLDSLYEQLVGQIARQRKLTRPHVKYAIDHAPLGADAALEYKLVDRLVRRLDWREQLSKQIDPGKKLAWVSEYEKKQGPSVDFSNPFALLGAIMGQKNKKEIDRPTIAIIHADGMIIPGKSGRSMFGQKYLGAETMVETFAEVTGDDDVVAVVFRIDSPGGSALASEIIHQAVARCAAKKPVIVSIGNMGASGGYYIAAPGKEIYADPASLVGSIGVVSGKFGMEGLFDKIGVSTHTITRGKNAGLFLSRAWSQREKELMRAQAERIYDIFIDRVKTGRGDRLDGVRIEDVAQGRVFTGAQAVDKGLVDEVGGLQEAIARARKLSGERTPEYIFLPRPSGFADMFTGAGVETPAGLPDASAAMLARLGHQNPAIAYLLAFMEQMQQESIMTALPYHLKVKP